jgi:hypothetical protein
VPGTRSDRARYQIVPGTWSCQVPIHFIDIHWRKARRSSKGIFNLIMKIRDFLICGLIWHLKGFGSMENTPTGRGSDLPTILRIIKNDRKSISVNNSLVRIWTQTVYKICFTSQSSAQTRRDLVTQLELKFLNPAATSPTPPHAPSPPPGPVEHAADMLHLPPVMVRLSYRPPPKYIMQLINQLLNSLYPIYNAINQSIHQSSN